MRNIFILPTSNISRLHTYSYNRLALSSSALSWNEAKHVYVTSDEPIVKGDYYVHDDIVRKAGYEISIDTAKKIVLTSDPTLVKDGVQETDNEFLEWLVDNQLSYQIKIERLETNRPYLINFKESTYCHSRCDKCNRSFVGDKKASICEPCANEIIESAASIIPGIKLIKLTYSELDLIKRMITVYWFENNSDHEDNLIDRSTSNNILNKLVN